MNSLVTNALYKSAPGIGFLGVTAPAEEARTRSNAYKELAIVAVAATRTVCSYPGGVQSSNQVSHAAVNFNSDHAAIFCQYLGGSFFSSKAHAGYPKKGG
jgi:hypothetical protein